MAYGPAQQIPPGLWAKAGRDNDGSWHILISEHEANIRDGSSYGHDHYYKKNGLWYVQIRASPNALLARDAKGHLLEDNFPFGVCSPEYLDNLFRQLVEA